MITVAEIREKVGALGHAQLSLDDFEDWLVQTSWNMHRDSDSDAQNLVGVIEMALWEYGDGHMSEAALREQIDAFVFPLPSPTA